MALYRKSGVSNDQLTNSILNSDCDTRRGVKDADKSDSYAVKRPSKPMDGQSQEESDKLKRSMTVILEEELEDSNMNFT